MANHRQAKEGDRRGRVIRTQDARRNRPPAQNSSRNRLAHRLSGPRRGLSRLLVKIQRWHRSRTTAMGGYPSVRFWVARSRNRTFERGSTAGSLVPRRGHPRLAANTRFFENSAHHREHDFSPRMLPFALQHLMGDLHCSKRQNGTHTGSELPLSEEAGQNIQPFGCHLDEEKTC